MKRLLTVFLALVVAISVLMTGVGAEEVKLISAKPEINFTDVDKDSTAGKAIYKLANAGILVGDGDGTFRPGAPIKRAELCKIVNSIFGYTEKDTTGFSDVTPANWYYDHVLIAKKAGYIVGYDDGTFKGENYVTREQSCAILCRVANLVDVGSTVEIKDAVSEWAMPYVQKVLGNKLMSLEKDNTFRAQENIKRDEYSVVYANFVQETPTESEKPAETDKPTSGDGPSGSGNAPSGGGNSGGGNSGGGNSGGGNGGGGTTPSEPDTPSGGGNGGGTTPSEPDTPSGGGNGGGTTPSEPDEPDVPDVPDTPDEPDEPDTPVVPDEPDEPEEPIDYETINNDIWTNLDIISKDIANNIEFFSSDESYLMLDIIYQVIIQVMDDCSSNIIDREYISKTYYDIPDDEPNGDIDVKAAKGYFAAIKADTKLKGDFQNEVASLKVDTIEWLMEAFNIDMSELIG